MPILVLEYIITLINFYAETCKYLQANLKIFQQLVKQEALEHENSRKRNETNECVEEKPPNSYFMLCLKQKVDA